MPPIKEILEKIWLTFGDIEDDAIVFYKLEETEEMAEAALNMTDYGYIEEKAKTLQRLAKEISLWAHKRMEEIK